MPSAARYEGGCFDRAAADRFVIEAFDGRDWEANVGRIR